MSSVTENLSRFIKEKRINLAAMARDTNLPYMSLYASLMNESRDRDLKDEEFLRICNFLDVDPMTFLDGK